jgi:hypothetical protein
MWSAWYLKLIALWIILDLLSRTIDCAVRYFWGKTTQCSIQSIYDKPRKLSCVHELVAQINWFAFHKERGRTWSLKWNWTNGSQPNWQAMCPSNDRFVVQKSQMRGCLHKYHFVQILSRIRALKKEHAFSPRGGQTLSYIGLNVRGYHVTKDFS